VDGTKSKGYGCCGEVTRLAKRAVARSNWWRGSPASHTRTVRDAPVRLRQILRDPGMTS